LEHSRDHNHGPAARPPVDPGQIFVKAMIIPATTKTTIAICV
jgi:hypothetical protein